MRKLKQRQVLLTSPRLSESQSGISTACILTFVYIWWTRILIKGPNIPIVHQKVGERRLMRIIIILKEAQKILTLDEVIQRVKRWVFSGEPPKSLSPLPEKNLAVDRIQIESRMIDPLYFGIQCLQVNLQGSNLLNASYFSFYSSSQPHGSMNKSSWPHSSFTFEKHLHGCLVQSTSCSSQLFHSFYRMGMDI